MSARANRTTSPQSAEVFFSNDDGVLSIRASAPWVVFALLLPALVVGIWMTRRVRTYRREKRNAEQAQQHLAEGREKERQRIARELHDGPIQDLYAVRMLMAFPSAQTETPVEYLLDVVDELRTISEDLRPPSLGPFGCAAALSDLADRFQERTPNLSVNTDLPPWSADAPASLPQPVALVLFRVAQEAMNNAVQHGEASHVQLMLRVDDEEVVLVVEDDGSGFDCPDDLTALAPRGHYGLAGMSERVSSVSGTLTIRSQTGGGTQIRASVPRGGEASKADRWGLWRPFAAESSPVSAA